MSSNDSYHFASLRLDKESRLECIEACQIHVERFAAAKAAFLGPATGAELSAAGVELLVSGADDGDEVARFDKDCVIEARVFAPHGTLRLKRDIDASGIFIGRVVLVDNGVRVSGLDP